MIPHRQPNAEIGPDLTTAAGKAAALRDRPKGPARAGPAAGQASAAAALRGFLAAGLAAGLSEASGVFVAFGLEALAARARFGRTAASSSSSASAEYTASFCRLGTELWQPVKPKSIVPA